MFFNKEVRLANFENTMVDLETLGVGESAVFPVLCAVRFDMETGEIGDCFYRNISVSDQLNSGRTTDGKTIEWWLKQDILARESLMADGSPLRVVLTEFWKWMYPGAIVWANGIDFDLSILQHAYNRNTPWEFWNQRDSRTVVKLSGINTKEIVFEGTKHNAKDDCVYQINTLRMALIKMGVING